VNRFNLTFKGEILPGRKAEQVKLRFGKMFAIDDPVRLERFFSGQTIILRRNLDRKTAAEYFQKLRKLGVEVELVKVTAQNRAATITKAPPSPTDTEEAARREDAEHKAAEEAARQQAAETAREEALREEAERKAAEEAERRQAELAEKKRIAEEEAARQRELREDEERKAAEEAARQQAELAGKKRIAEEEAARQRELREEEERKAAEEAAQQQAELAEKERREEEARQKALREEAERKATEEAAHLKAEEQRKKAQERARLKARRAEEAARKKALKEEARRKAEEEAARRKAAEKQARRKAELAEKKRIEAEEAARLKAELAEQKRKADEEVAREQAILKEAKRKADEETAREQAILDEAKRKAAAEVARLHAEQEEVAREAAERIARLRAEQEEVARKAAEEVARIEAEQQREKEEQTAQRKAMEEHAVQRAAAALAQQAALKPVKARVKTTLEVPLRKSNREGQPSAIAPRRRQPGEPNLYSLHPFRNTPEVRARAEQAQARMRAGFIAAALALVGLLLLGGRFLSLPTVPVITGAGAMAIDEQAGLLLLAGDSLLLHDRSGVGTGTLPWKSLGLAALQAPMAFDTAGELLALGRLKAAGAEVPDVESLQLLRCKLTESLCRPFSAELASSSITGFAIHKMDGTVFLADATNGHLLRASADGSVLARAPAAIPDNPVMRLESGLLFMNSALGPAVSVFRYDDNAFGQQLDEILLRPPAAIEAEQSRVGDFVWSADNWWASMYNPQTNSAGLYRFDEQWNFIEQAELPGETWPQQLATWADKTLVRDAHHIPIQRFNASGAPEAPLVSDLLESLVARQQRNINLTGMAWRVSLILCALVAIASLFLGSLQRLRALVYKSHRERGADPVDEHVDAVHWIDPSTDRRAQLRRITISYAVIALALLLLAITRHVASIQLAAALIALSGPAIALLLLSRSSVGNIGILQEQLLLVDHRGMYHLGGGPRVQYRGPFVLLDDVMVFTGTRLLPAFSSKQVADGVTPLAEAGIRVDRKTVIVKILQGRHPLAQGAVAVLVSFTAAAALLCLQGIFELSPYIMVD
jgi:hypothetical protein